MQHEGQVKSVRLSALGCTTATSVCTQGSKSQVTQAAAALEPTSMVYLCLPACRAALPEPVPRHPSTPPSCCPPLHCQQHSACPCQGWQHARVPSCLRSCQGVGVHAIRAAQHVELSMGRDNIVIVDGVLLGSLPGSTCNMRCCLSLSLHVWLQLCPLSPPAAQRMLTWGSWLSA